MIHKWVKININLATLGYTFFQPVSATLKNRVGVCRRKVERVYQEEVIQLNTISCSTGSQHLHVHFHKLLAHSHFSPCPHQDQKIMFIIVLQQIAPVGWSRSQFVVTVLLLLCHGTAQSLIKLSTFWRPVWFKSIHKERHDFIVITVCHAMVSNKTQVDHIHMLLVRNICLRRQYAYCADIHLHCI